MNFKLVKLNFTSPLHLGSGKPDHYDHSESVLHSDTIKSAIFSTALLLNNALGEDFFINFKVSSAFPYLNNKLFFPLPHLPADVLTGKFNVTIEGSEKNNYDDTKIIRKINYLEKTLFEQFIGGEVISVNIRNQGKQQFISGFLLDDFMNTNDFNILKSEPQQRVYVSRISEILAADKPKFTDPYYVDKIFFGADAGLFFLLVANEEYLSIIGKALELLQDFGFGTDRNIGNGQFNFEIEEFDLLIPEEADLQTNLSLYLPGDNEMEKLKNANDVENKMFYTLLERGGYISNFLDQEYGTLLKNPVMMFDVGSVFPNIELSGRIADVTPGIMDKHRVWRDGSSIFIPVKI